MTPSVDLSKTAVELLPPHKRLPNFIAWLLSCYSQITRNNLRFSLYQNGSNAPNYNDANNYSIGDLVNYKRKIYIALDDDPVGFPDISNKWELLLENFIGAKERSKYTFNKIVLEYALNRYFQTTFRQPPAQSDIYITREAIVDKSFTVFSSEQYSDSVFLGDSTGYIYSDEIFAVASTYTFVIHIPSSIFSTLGSQVLAESTVRKFVDNYVRSGIFYKIITY